MSEIVDGLLASDEPSIRWKVRSRVLGDAEDSLADLRRKVKDSPRVRALLSNRDESGRIFRQNQTYKKWKGAHWVFAHLADIGYPTGDPELIPMRDQVQDFDFGPLVSKQFCEGKWPNRLNGRARFCASLPGNALFSTVALGLISDRCHDFAELLIKTQWPDGGWNCDKNPEADTSSFWETLIPLRGLIAYAQATGDKQAKQAADRAAEVFLSRRLFHRISDGGVMNPQFVRLHYPCYWRYDILFGLKVMAEGGYISDPRCADALDLLESKRLPDGGWPAEERFYAVTKDLSGRGETVSWGKVSKTRMNEWVTADALGVLKVAGKSI
ncbi:MAG: hypothetical protein KBC96_01295 [Armatimonadetes bacterium]|nr:hypothetical protein [Armatimonadota bacterium]